jgi:hypothetical protein
MNRRGFLAQLGFGSVAISTLLESDKDYQCEVGKTVAPKNMDVYVTPIAISGYERRSFNKNKISQDAFTDICQEEAFRAKGRILERLHNDSR